MHTKRFLNVSRYRLRLHSDVVLGMEDDKRGLVAIVCWREVLNIPKKKLEG